MRDLQIEINTTFQRASDVLAKGEGIRFMITPPLDEDYWLFRVKLYEDQAMLGFPKFGVIGIGFAQEEDWNTNLPFTCDTMQIFDHIKHNKKYEQIPDEECIEAIRLIQKSVDVVMEAK